MYVRVYACVYVYVYMNVYVVCMYARKCESKCIFMCMYVCVCEYCSISSRHVTCIPRPTPEFLAVVRRSSTPPTLAREVGELPTWLAGLNPVRSW